MQLLARIEQAVQQLAAADQPLTQQAICAVIGLSPNTLRHYRRAKAAVERGCFTLPPRAAYLLA